MGWLDRWFGRPPQAAAPPSTARTETLSEDYASARDAGREVVGLVMNSLKDARGIHLESLFCALGALAGRACQVSVRESSIRAGRPAEAGFAIAETADGRRFYFGDALNRPLAEDRVSLWSLVAGAAAHDGARSLPEVTEIFKHTAEVLGTEAFGVPRLPAEHPLQATPLDYATRLWPEVRRILSARLEQPGLWPVALGLAIQEVMSRTRGTLSPELIARIVMESAIPVSKVPAE
jgi:hypothetical protein